MGALTVDSDMAAYVIVDALIRQRTQEDQQREHRPQQLGSEHRGPIDQVKGLQSRPEVLNPRSLVATACGGELPARLISRRVVFA